MIFVLELTKKCNNNCLYCYNVWKAHPEYPSEELSAKEWRKLVSKLAQESGPSLFSISGGEPLMRDDFFRIARAVGSHNIPVNLITNGTRLSPQSIKKCIDCGVTLFELPLLSANPDIHDKLTGNSGSWKKVISSIKEIKRQEASLAVVLVITKLNISEVRETMEIAIALGADAFLVNRFNVGGAGIKNKARLSPSLRALAGAFTEINELSGEYEVQVSSGVPIPWCVLDTSQFENVRFSKCPLGTNNQYFAVDPAGNVRPCNHSSLILGNLLNKSIKEILTSKTLCEYLNTVPYQCKKCRKIKSCNAGCRAAAEEFFGDCHQLDPFVLENFQGVAH